MPSELDGAVCSTGFCVLRTDVDLLDSEYLFTWVRSPSFVQSLVRLQRGIGYPAVSDNEVKSIHIPLPLLPEQRRIVAILRQADDLRRERREIDEQAKELVPLIFRDMFGDPDPKRSRIIRDTVRLGDVFDVGTGGTPSRSRSDYYQGEHPWVKTTELRDGVIHDTDEKLTDKGLNSSNAKLYPPETILVAMYGQGQTRGRTGKLAVSASCNQACASFPAF